MLRAASSAGRISARGLRSTIARRIFPATPIAVHRLALATLSATKPVGVGATKKTELTAAPVETEAAVPAGKISQVIGAVVDVHFGKFASCTIMHGKVVF